MLSFEGPTKSHLTNAEKWLESTIDRFLDKPQTQDISSRVI